jgi:PAS domain S-box-containing protein
VASIVSAAAIDQFSDPTFGLSNALLALGVALAAWVGGWAGGLIALSVFPIALAFWPAVPPREWIVCSAIVVIVALARVPIERLRRSENKLRALLASMNDVILVLDGEGTYVEIIPTAPELLYRPSAELLGRRIAEFFSPEQTESFLRSIRAARDERRTVNVDYSLIIEGRVVWFSACVSPINDRCVLWVARDITQRKEAEEHLQRANAELEQRVEQRTRELKATELRYRSMVDQATDLIFTLTRDRRITSVNPAFARITGYRAGDWIGRDFVDLIAVEMRPEASRRFAQALAKGSLDDVTARIERADGSSVILEGSVVSQMINGENVGFLGFARDVTERRGAEEELRRTEERLAEAQRLAKIGTWELDLETERLWWSDESYRIFGLRPSHEQLTLDDSMRFVAEEDRPKIPGITKTLLERGQHEWELAIHAADGVDRIINCRGQIIGKGSTRRLIGTNQDVTETRRAEKLLRESDERFRLIARATSDAVWDLDYATGQVWRGEGYETLFGYAPGSIAPNAEAFRELVHPDDRERLTRSFREAIDSGQLSFTHEFRFRRADGSYAEILDRGYVVRDAERRPVRVLGAMVDVTERKQMAQQLEHTKRLSSLGRLAGSIAHEFNNVLMGVQANAEIIGRRAPAELRGVVDNVIGAVRRGRRITEEILRFIRPSDPAPRSLHVRRFLEQWADEIRPSLRGRVELEMDVADDDLHIRADPQQIAQVFTNMAFNSRDAVPDAGGRLAIRAELANSYSRFNFGVVETPDRFVHFRLTDNGAGIVGEQLPHIFEPLFTTKRDGTGLGLAVSHQIVTRSDGHIFVESEPGQGTTFHIFLPLSLKQLELDAPAAPESVASLGRILLVEDEPEVAAGVGMLLEAEGAVVAVARTGAETIPAIECFRPDIVILDIGLPDMDGVAVYSQIAHRWPDLRVLFSSGHAQARNLEQWLARPNVALLVKPYEMSDLRQALSRLLETAVAA